MVRIANSDIPNLSDIVEETFDSIYDICHGNMMEFDEIDTDVDISMNDDLEDYTLDVSDVSSDE